MQGQPETGSADGGCPARAPEGACGSEYLGTVAGLQERLRHLQGKILDLNAAPVEPAGEDAAGAPGAPAAPHLEELQPRMIARSGSEQALLAMYRERRRKLEQTLGVPPAQQQGLCGDAPPAAPAAADAAGDAPAAPWRRFGYAEWPAAAPTAAAADAGGGAAAAPWLRPGGAEWACQDAAAGGGGGGAEAPPALAPAAAEPRGAPAARGCQGTAARDLDGSARSGGGTRSPGRSRPELPSALLREPSPPSGPSGLALQAEHHALFSAQLRDHSPLPPRRARGSLPGAPRGGSPRRSGAGSPGRGASPGAAGGTPRRAAAPRRSLPSFRDAAPAPRVECWLRPRASTPPRGGGSRTPTGRKEALAKQEAALSNFVAEAAALQHVERSTAASSDTDRPEDSPGISTSRIVKEDSPRFSTSRIVKEAPSQPAPYGVPAHEPLAPEDDAAPRGEAAQVPAFVEHTPSVASIGSPVCSGTVRLASGAGTPVQPPRREASVRAPDAAAVPATAMAPARAGQPEARRGPADAHVARGAAPGGAPGGAGGPAVAPSARPAPGGGAPQGVVLPVPAPAAVAAVWTKPALVAPQLLFGPAAPAVAHHAPPRAPTPPRALAPPRAHTPPPPARGAPPAPAAAAGRPAAPGPQPAAAGAVAHAFRVGGRPWNPGPTHGGGAAAAPAAQLPAPWAAAPQAAVAAAAAAAAERSARSPRRSSPALRCAAAPVRPLVVGSTVAISHWALQ